MENNITISRMQAGTWGFGRPNDRFNGLDDKAIPLHDRDAAGRK
jgi:hypothetical protein